MCFAPQRRELFRPLNFQKCSEPVSFLHFWLRDVLRATTACTFSTSQLRKVVRAWCVSYILTLKCASRHNGVHFFDIWTSKKWSEHRLFCTFWLGNVLRATTACNFSSLIWPAGSAPAALASLLFDPPEPQIIVKTQFFATFLPFRAPVSSFFWDVLFFDLLSSSLLFSSLTLPISAFHLSISSEVSQPLQIYLYHSFWPASKKNGVRTCFGNYICAFRFWICFGSPVLPVSLAICSILGLEIAISTAVCNILEFEPFIFRGIYNILVLGLFMSHGILHHLGLV